MTLWIMVLFALGMAGCLAASVFFYSQGNASKNSALILSRVNTIGGDNALTDLASVRVNPRRLAQSFRLQKWLNGAPFIESMADLLDQGGSPLTVAQLISHMGLCSLIVGTASLILGCHPPAAMCVGLISGGLPLFLALRRRARRTSDFETQLPQALELIGLYLRSGRSLPQAFVATCEEMIPPASEELAITAEEYRLGRPLDVALKRLAKKFEDSVGLRLFSISVSVLGQTGGNLVEVLDRIRRTLDATMTYQLKLRSMTGESRTSALILGALPGLFMIMAALSNPAYFNQFFESGLGLFLFGLFVTLWVIGNLWIRALMASNAKT